MAPLAQTAPSLPAAYAACARLARSHYENFTVVSWFLPRGLKQHFHAVYAFCRTVDDLGDEAPGGPEGRLRLLDNFESALRAALAHGRGAQPCAPTTADAPPFWIPLFTALAETSRRFDIPLTPYLKLIEANRLDQRRPRHPTFKDLLYYCDHSANPVGHLVLYLFGHRDAERQRLSDCTCTALQLTNFWQDIKVDWGKGRIYLPVEDMERFGVTERHIAEGRVDDDFRKLLAYEVGQARALFEEGLKLVPKVDARLRKDLRLFSLGGMAILDAIEKAGYDVFRRRPTLSKRQKAWLMVRQVMG
jgi:squalene synthase HpnC